MTSAPTPLFSIITPAYNLESYIATTIESVFNQSCQDFEYLIVDDGSSDGTAEVVRSFADPRLRLIEQSNQGVSAARNHGITEAKGTYIAFLDGDDYWYPHHLETARLFFEEHPEIPLFAGRFKQHRLGSALPLLQEESPSRPFEIVNYFQSGYTSFCSSSAVILRELLLKTELFPLNVKIGEDIYLWYQLALLSPQMGLGHQVSALYMQRESSAMYNDFSFDTSYRFLELLHRLKKKTSPDIIPPAQNKALNEPLFGTYTYLLSSPIKKLLLASQGDKETFGGLNYFLFRSGLKLIHLISALTLKLMGRVQKRRMKKN